MIKQRDILIILWMTFVTVVAWIGFNIYHAMVTSTISEELQMQILPIDPDFDTVTINKLKNRQNIEPLYRFEDTSRETAASAAASIPSAPIEKIIPSSETAPIEASPSPEESPVTEVPVPQGSEAL